MRTAGAEDSSAELERKNIQLARAARRRQRADYWQARFAELAVAPSRLPVPSPRADLDDAHNVARRAAHLAAITKFGSGPLPINPATGKRWYGTGKQPKSGINSPVHPKQIDLPPVHFAGRYRSRRERAAELRERMACFASIYNAGWLVRDAQSTTTQRLDEAMMRFVAVLLQEIRTCRDFEALIYAVADTITCSRHGVPWEE